MKTYVKFLINNFLNSFFFVFLIIFCLVFILNLLSEVDFFKDISVKNYLTIYLSLLNSPAYIFEILPFIFLLATQIFYIKIANGNQVEIFKYFGLKNLDILKIISLVGFILGFFFITIFYNFSSNLKNFYLVIKSNYTSDNKYLAVITNNGLWIKDKIENKILIISASEIKKNFLIDTFISEFNEKNEIIRNIKSEKINIEDNIWIIYKPTIINDNEKILEDTIKISSNFNYKKIQNLFSNLSSLSIFELINLRDNYYDLGYSTNEIDLHMIKLLTFPFNFILMVIFSSIIMNYIKNYQSNSLKISLGLFCCVIIYYINNFFYAIGIAGSISVVSSIFIPLIIFTAISLIMLKNINEK